ncbi:MarR family transcriptional regulator [Pedobacter psychroterrae]|uniref:MarR family transcriptional regulator n=1 Tax=Pedobacter psychroterrae TaxID=2530453 RepID=A0A4R0NUQ2_9SPHI|nr:MarR family transcriptional regulator [Pedobacter psychroterrae]TCD03225.1 MarR family transcriptional regulator [Pedobacter psychroterrae]
MSPNILDSKNYALNVSWRMISLISRIERFDELWPVVSKKEQALLCKWSVPEKWNVYDLFAELETCSDSFTEYNALVFWYEAETDILPLIKCLLFAWYLQFIANIRDVRGCVNYNMMVQMLFNGGYGWAIYLPFDGSSRICCMQDMEVNDWVLSVLSFLDDCQQEIMHKIDLGILAWKQIATEELLLHIIENNNGIKTTAIGRKLGTSIATVKRMLNRLIEKSMIERYGVGRGTRYRLI